MATHEPEPAPPNGATSSNPELDIKKLHALPSEQQELYLLTFSSDLARHVASLDADGASAHQIYIKKELFQIIHLASPPPTRVIRENLGRAFHGIFSKGDRKLLFESINELVGVLNGAGKLCSRLQATARLACTPELWVHCCASSRLHKATRD
jgi:hypothetical protein